MTNTKTTPPKFDFKGFINLEVAQEDRAAVKQWVDSQDPTVEDALVALTEAGYKVGFSYDDYHGVNQVALTCKDPGSMYFGFCFTFKHSSPSRGALVCQWLYDTHLKTEQYPIPSLNSKYDW